MNFIAAVLAASFAVELERGGSDWTGVCAERSPWQALQYVLELYSQERDFEKRWIVCMKVRALPLGSYH